MSKLDFLGLGGFNGLNDLGLRDDLLGGEGLGLGVRLGSHTNIGYCVLKWAQSKGVDWNTTPQRLCQLLFVKLLLPGTLILPQHLNHCCGVWV